MKSSTDAAMEIAQTGITKGEQRSKVVGEIIAGGMNAAEAEAIYDRTVSHPITQALLRAQKDAQS